MSSHGPISVIGLRSTRIRTPERTIVSVPNADFSGMQLEIDPEQRLIIAVEGIERRDIQERGHAGTPI